MTKYTETSDHGPNTEGATIKPTDFKGTKRGNEIRSREFGHSHGALDVGVDRPKGLKTEPWLEAERQRLTNPEKNP
jgi:hypothetical protein